MGMKKIYSIALALCMALVLFAACGEKAPAQSGISEEAQPLSVNNLSGCSELIGVVDVYTGDTMTVASASEGTEYVLDLTGAELRCTNGVKMGDNVTVFYSGSLTGTGSEAASIVLVVDNAAKASQTLGTMHGVIVEATMNNIIIQATDGAQYDFDKSGAQVDAVNGLANGNNVTITYTVTEGRNIAVTIIDNAANTVEYTPLPAGTTFVAGTETLMAATNINVRNGAGKDYTRIGGITAGSKVYLTGTCSNGWARINYNGKEGYVAEENLVAVPQENKPAAQPAATQPAVQKPTPTPVQNTGNTGSAQPQIGQGATMANDTAPVVNNDPGIGNGVTAADDTAPVENNDPGIGQGAAMANDTAPVAEQTGSGIGSGVTVAEDTAPAPEPEFGDMSGTVVDITGDTLTITGNDGNTYIFNVAGASRQYANGIQVGNPISLHYSGELNGTDTSGITVLTVVDNAPNAPIAAMVSVA